MVLNYLNYYDNAETVFFFKDEVVTSDVLGLHFYDGKGKQTGLIPDFFDGTDGILFEKYLILRNMRLGFSLYDLEEKKLVKKLELGPNEIPNKTSYFIKEGKLYIGRGTLASSLHNGIFQFGAEMGEELPTKPNNLLVYSIPDFEFLEEIPIKEKYSTIGYVSFLKKYYFISSDFHLYFMDENNHVCLNERYSNEVDDVLVSEETKELYLVYKRGIRIFDEGFFERKKIDIVSDELVPCKRLLLVGNGDDFETKTKMTLKEEILDIVPFDEKHVVVLTTEDNRGIFIISVLSLESGKREASITLPVAIYGIFALDKKHFSFSLKDGRYIMEVNQDD